MPYRRTKKYSAERLRAERADALRKLRLAEITLRDRAHPSSEPRDTPEVLADGGFWPDCGCGECYAIHCLGNALAERDAMRAERDALRADALRYRWLRERCAWLPIDYMSNDDAADDFDAAIDAAMASQTTGTEPGAEVA